MELIEALLPVEDRCSHFEFAYVGTRFHER